MSAPSQKRDPFGIVTLLQNRELLRELFKRRLSQEHKGTFVGAAWLVVRPLTLLALYVFVFGYVFQGRFENKGDAGPATYALGVFLGLTIIHFFTDIIAASPRCIADNPRLVKRVKMPVEIIPISVAATASVHFFISLGLALLGLLIFGHPPGWQALWLVPLFAFLAIGGAGLAYLFAVIGVYSRDVTQITPVLNMGLLFASAVFYPIEKIPPGAWAILKYNPALLAVEATRETALWGIAPPLGIAALYFCSICLALYFIGYLFFRKTKPHFADLI